mmetsp:Transcript_2691/g.4913  ORF Transcript_2691/g.4913 Transcript_2691/m.4913 type:complete len:117 (+) Transcript_2691:166-516(+)
MYDAKSNFRKRHFPATSTAATMATSAVSRPNARNVSETSSKVNFPRTKNIINNVALDKEKEREIQLIKSISDRLETGLDEYALEAVVDLLKRGEHPDAIVAVVTSLSQRSSGNAHA